MEFSNRNVQPQAAASGAQTTAAGHAGNSRRKKDRGEMARIVTTLLIGAVVILLLGVIAVISSSNNVKPENKYVDKTKLQAVFLNTGQVYFGKITTLNTKYFVVTNIYYLQTAGGTSGTTSTANTSVSLVKLGCELHEPLDQMVINRDQVTFWENLGDNGQVANAVKTFQKQNPSGQKCADQSSSAGTNTSNSAQNAGSSTTKTTTTPTTTTTPSTTTTKP